MQQAGLFDILRGRFYDGTPVASVGERSQRLQSVMSNLSRLLNTRQGALEHLPDYGLPDAATIYRDADYPIEQLRKDIREAIEKYEPRLLRVHIERQSNEGDEMRLAFLITAQLQDGERVRFRTEFGTSNLVEVSPWTRSY